MKYQQVVNGKFKARPNRFIAKVEIDGQVETVHVKNTGRCKELLLEDAEVYLAVSDNPNRKTKYDLIGVEKKREKLPPLLVNMDSQAPNQVAYEWVKKCEMFSKNAEVRREVTYGSSRFDLYVSDGERKAFIEVKGVTLEKNGIALFPDALTERGVKHIRELIKCISDGYEAYLLFVIQMKDSTSFSPNNETQPEFGEALREAQKAGVTILAYDCLVTKNTLEMDKPIPVIL